MNEMGTVKTEKPNSKYYALQNIFTILYGLQNVTKYLLVWKHIVFKINILYGPITSI